MNIFVKNALASVGNLTQKLLFLFGVVAVLFVVFVGTTQIIGENTYVSSILSANFSLDMPFDSTDAGLEVITSGEDIVSQEAPDDGANQMVNILVTIFHGMKWILGFLAFLWIVISGVYMVSNSSDEAEAKK